MTPPDRTRTARIGGTVLFALMLGTFAVLIVCRQYQACIALSVAGIYAEMWNARISK